MSFAVPTDPRPNLPNWISGQGQSLIVNPLGGNGLNRQSRPRRCLVAKEPRQAKTSSLNSVLLAKRVKQVGVFIHKSLFCGHCVQLYRLYTAHRLSYR